MRRPLRVVYGFERNGSVYLSPFPASFEKRPTNSYGSREEAEAHARQRNCQITWEEPVATD